MIWRTALSLASHGRLSILIFHRVLPRPDPLLPGEPSATEFAALLAHLARRFTVLPLDEAIRKMSEGSLPSRALAITFDDGYADNLSIAAPILRAHCMPATIFVATGYLDGGCMFNDAIIEAFRSAKARELDLSSLGLGMHRLDSWELRRVGLGRVIAALKYQPERDASAREVLRIAGAALPHDQMLRSSDVSALGDYGLDVGSHTITHPILSRTPDDAAWREISEGKRALERIAGRPVTLFAYPNGTPGKDYGARDVRMVREAGFSAAVSTAWGAASTTTDRFQLPRFTPWTRDARKFDVLMLRNLRGGFGRARISEAIV